MQMQPVLQAALASGNVEATASLLARQQQSTAWAMQQFTNDMQMLTPEEERAFRAAAA